MLWVEELEWLRVRRAARGVDVKVREESIDGGVGGGLRGHWIADVEGKLLMVLMRF